MEGLLIKIWGRIRSSPLVDAMFGFLAAIIAFLGGLLLLSERRRKNAEETVRDSQERVAELEAREEVSETSLRELVDSDNRDKRARK